LKEVLTMKISRLTIGLGLAAVVGLLGLVEASASPFAMFFLADDLGNRVVGAAPEASEWESDGADSGSDTGGGDSGGGDSGGGNNGGGNNGGGDSAKSNNGHGNNEDGVDSSNPGNSKTGEDLDPAVDDEMSKGKKK
jgi:hypothetical protein